VTTNPDPTAALAASYAITDDLYRLIREAIADRNVIAGDIADEVLSRFTAEWETDNAGRRRIVLRGEWQADPSTSGAVAA
jgi:hypothetical protein